MADRPLISVLIVNFHSTARLRECLDALAASTIAAALEVIVVDNATPGFDAPDIARDDLDLHVLPQDRNTTFTGGNNIAFAAAAGRYVLMLNPDTRVEPEALERAIAHFEANPGLVALGAWFTDEDGRLRPYYRRLPRLRDVPVAIIPRLLDWTPMSRRYRMADTSFGSSTLVEQPAGAFIMIRREACPEPLLDPGYFNFFSDVELCRGLLERGAIRVESDVRCYHARGGAGLVTHEPTVVSRLHHDLAWGIQYYFRDVGTRGHAWVLAWVLAMWVVRLAQACLGGRTAVSAAWVGAHGSLGRTPPRYTQEPAKEIATTHPTL